MAVRPTKVTPKPSNGRRGPLAHSGNDYKPAHDYVRTLKGRERAYAKDVVEYATHLRVTGKPESLLSPERTRDINTTLFNFFSTEEPR